jgi:aminopeptidase N
VKNKIYSLVFASVLIAACTTSRKSQDVSHTAYTTRPDTLAKKETLPYHPSETRIIDIIHTKLDVSFNWEKQYLYGKATIT